ncbi:MAG: glycosyltransferase family 2 protein [Lachnospiraceae bacterium]|nr:glycosyltransferase family 2 protein [Lachnospiraceae bacterium]
MKVLTIAIPCYNAAAYMGKAIDYAVLGGEDVEVLVIDDGSTLDKTLEIAREYEKKYPGIVRAIHQENKGHGGAVNTGIREAKGLYFKVCDSDDYLDYEALCKVMKVLRQIAAGKSELDLLICNYMYDKAGAKHKKVMRYTGHFPENRIFGWDEVKKPLRTDQYVLMHSLIYRTELLRANKIELPEHTFYVDNLMVFQPGIYAKTMYYLNETLYRYYIGRTDQSVNEEVMLGRMDQQLKVTRMMIDAYRPDLVNQESHMDFLVHYMQIMMSVSSILLMRKGSDEAIREKKGLWEYLKNKDRKLYHKIRSSFLGAALNLPGKTGRRLVVRGYSLAQKIYGFN